MSQTSVQLADICEAILTAYSATPSDDGPNRWVFGGGKDTDGDPRVVVARLVAPNIWIVSAY